MSRKIQDGVFVDNSVYIIDEKKTGFPIPTRVIQYLAIVVGSWSAVTVLMECLTIPVNLNYINMVILIVSAAAFALCLFTSYDVVKLFFGILFYGLFFYSRLPKIQNGFYILENLVINRLSSYYGYKSMRFVADYATATEDSTLLMIMYLVPVIVMLTIAVVRSRCVNLTGLIIFLPVSISFILGIIPSEQYLIAYIMSMLYLTKSGYSHHSSDKQQKSLLHRINSSAAVWLTVLCFLMFLGMKLIIPEERYDGVVEIKEIKSQVQTGLFDFSIEDAWEDFTDFRFPGTSKASGGLNGGKLGKTGQVDFNNSEQLRLRAPQLSLTEGVYLKGYVGSVYTGDEWQEHSKDTRDRYNDLQKRIITEEFDPINQISLLLNRMKDRDQAAADSLEYNTSLFNYNNGSMSVDYKSANKKYMYAPYYTDYGLLEGIEYEKDLYPAPKKKRGSYEFHYYYNLEKGYMTEFIAAGGVLSKELMELMGSYSEYEKQYRNFVYQAYTNLPKDGLERLKKEFSKEKINPVADSMPEKIAYVRDYLLNNTQYSLSPGRLPDGKDFVEYFLYENRIGYCAHYASAATLMLRSMGIPARYIEGYAVSSSDIIVGPTELQQDITTHANIADDKSNLWEVEVSVKDYNAHAWVEVYFDYFGWVPVEFTPGSVIDFNGTMLEEMAAAGDDMERGEEAIRPDLTQAPVVPSPTPNIPQVSQPVQKDPKDMSERDGKTGAGKFNPDFFLLLFLASIPVITLLTMFCIRLHQRKKAFRSINHNKKALFLFKEAEKILSVWHALPDKGGLEDNEDYVSKYCFYIDSEDFIKFMETAKRARFGNGSIPMEDIKGMEQFHYNLYHSVYRDLNNLRKLYFRWILFT